MSPYRVELMTSSGDRIVLCAMIATNRNSRIVAGRKTIYIMDKTVLSGTYDNADAAYLPNSKKYSVIVGRYFVYANEDSTGYSLWYSNNAKDQDFQVSEKCIDLKCPTLHSCMVKAMNDYCARNSYTLLRTF